MYEQPDRMPAGDSAIQFSEKDRDDATRLLALVAGVSGAQSSTRPREPVRIARSILDDRRRRLAIFNGGMFGEPAWEILLNLFVVDKDGPRLTVTRLVELTGSAPTTSLRWLEYLEDHELITRAKHPTDARASLVQLTEKARQSLTTYLSGTLMSRL